MRVVTVARLSMLGLLLSGLLGMAVPVHAEALVEMAPTDTPGRYDVVATGFAANEMVSTWLTGPSQQVVPSDRHKVDHRGGIAFTLRVKRYAEPGRWALTVGGWESGREAIAYFDLPPFAPDIAVSVTPPSGQPGATFTFTATGFEEGERVSAWFTAPDGRTLDGDVVEAGREGRVAFQWATATGTPTGEWTMNAYGQSSDRLGVASFTVA
jgi:hypothetical protein